MTISKKSKMEINREYKRSQRERDEKKGMKRIEFTVSEKHEYLIRLFVLYLKEKDI